MRFLDSLALAPGVELERGINEAFLPLSALMLHLTPDEVKIIGVCCRSHFFSVGGNRVTCFCGFTTRSGVGIFDLEGEWDHLRSILERALGWDHEPLEAALEASRLADILVASRATIEEEFFWGHD